MGDVSLDLLERSRKKRLVDIEAGLIKNVHNALVHSFEHLQAYKSKSDSYHLKWAVVSTVQAGELLSNALLIRTNCPLHELFKVRKARDVFYPPSLEQDLLEKLEQYGMRDESPIKITSAELILLRNAQVLAFTRNELMHRTIIDLDDLGTYAKAALSINLVFEQRYHDVQYPEVESNYRLDAEAALQLSWMKGEASAYFKEAVAFLDSVNASKHAYLGCPVCGSLFNDNAICRVCRSELIQRECPQCGNEWIEHRDDERTFTKCPDCDR